MSERTGRGRRRRLDDDARTGGSDRGSKWCARNVPSGLGRDRRLRVLPEQALADRTPVAERDRPVRARPCARTSAYRASRPGAANRPARAGPSPTVALGPVVVIGRRVRRAERAEQDPDPEDDEDQRARAAPVDTRQVEPERRRREKPEADDQEHDAGDHGAGRRPRSRRRWSPGAARRRGGGAGLWRGGGGLGRRWRVSAAIGASRRVIGVALRRSGSRTVMASRRPGRISVGPIVAGPRARSGLGARAARAARPTPSRAAPPENPLADRRGRSGGGRMEHRSRARRRSASSAGRASTRSSTTSARSRSTRRTAPPSDSFFLAEVAGRHGRVPAAPRPAPHDPAAQDQLPGQRLGDALARGQGRRSRRARPARSSSRSSPATSSCATSSSTGRAAGPTPSTTARS